MPLRFSRAGVAVGVFCLYLLTTGAAAALEIRVSIENLAPLNGTFLTPMWVGFHDGSFDLYDSGAPAGTALERLAEDGDTAPLSAALLASGAGTVEGTIPGPAGPFAPGDSASMIFTLDISAPGSRFFSYASMIIPSNDAFIANDNPTAIPLLDNMNHFVGADFIVLGAMVNDAGTEVNDEVPMNTAFFGQMSPDTGVAEGGVVHVHPGFISGGPILSTPMFANADFTAPGYMAARIRVEAIPEPTTMALLGIGLVALAFIRLRASRT